MPGGAVRYGLLAAIGVLAAYDYAAIGLPGSAVFRTGGGLWGLGGGVGGGRGGGALGRERGAQRRGIGGTLVGVEGHGPQDVPLHRGGYGRVEDSRSLKHL